jgi:hypothetical protein
MTFHLDAFRVHRDTCSKCAGKRLCVDGWRLLNDTAWMIARTSDPKRATA